MPRRCARPPPTAGGPSASARSARAARWPSAAPPRRPAARSTYGPYEQQLARARTRQADPAWKTDYTATRPKVERKIGHLTRRKHGGRRARMRGEDKVGADFSLLAAATNLARLAVLGLTNSAGAWAPNPA